MRLTWNLPTRVAVAFACFGGVVAMVLCTGIYFFVLDIEKRIVDRNLNDEIQDYITRRRRNPQSLPPNTVTILGYVSPSLPTDPAVPPELLALEAGFHDIQLDAVSYRVLVINDSKERFFILYNNLSVRRQRELYLLLLLMIGCVAVTSLATVGGYWVAGMVIAPVSELARRVRAMGETDAGYLLEGHFSQDAVGELAKDLAHRQDQILGFLERERSFASDVSHELKNPLTVIQGAAEILQGLPLGKRGEQPIKRIARAVRDMNVLTSALLLLSRGENGANASETVCQVAVVLEDILEQNRHLLRNKDVQVQLVIDAQPVLQADCAFVQIVMSNLVRNACMYIHRGLVRIHLQDGQLTVTDTGTGITPDLLDKLFHERVLSPVGRGNGLGLTLVKRICDRHQWQVVIESQPDVGTVARFIFHVPAVQTARQSNSEEIARTLIENAIANAKEMDQ